MESLLLRQGESLGLQNHIHGCNEQVESFKSRWRKYPNTRFMSRNEVRLFLNEIFMGQNKEYGRVTIYVSVMRKANCISWCLQACCDTTPCVTKNLE